MVLAGGGGVGGGTGSVEVIPLLQPMSGRKRMLAIVAASENAEKVLFRNRQRTSAAKAAFEAQHLRHG